MEIETIFKLIELASILVVVTGLYWKQENRINLIQMQVNNNKSHSDESTNRLTNSIDKLQSTIERMNEKFNH